MVRSVDRSSRPKQLPLDLEKLLPRLELHLLNSSSLSYGIIIIDVKYECDCYEQDSVQQKKILMRQNCVVGGGSVDHC